MNRTIRPLATRVGQLGFLGQPATTVMSSRSRVIGGMSNIMRTSTTTRHYTSAPQQGGSGHNPLLWIGNKQTIKSFLALSFVILNNFIVVLSTRLYLTWCCVYILPKKAR